MLFFQNQSKQYSSLFHHCFGIQQTGDLATQCDPERQAASVCHWPLVTHSVFTTEERPSHTHTLISMVLMSCQSHTPSGAGEKKEKKREKFPNISVVNTHGGVSARRSCIAASFSSSFPLTRSCSHGCNYSDAAAASLYARHLLTDPREKIPAAAAGALRGWLHWGNHCMRLKT